MRRTVATIAVFVTALSGLTASPARATTVKVVTVTGSISVSSGGLGYPGVGHGGTPNVDKVPCTTGGTPDPSCIELKNGPKGEPIVNIRPEGNHAGISFASTACVKVSASTDLAKKTPGPALCAFSVDGVVWGYCGLSTGLGVATLTNQNPPPLTKETVSSAVKFTNIAGIWYLTGGSSRTWISGALASHPVPATPGGPDCLTKSANTFAFEGELYYKDLT